MHNYVASEWQVWVVFTFTVCTRPNSSVLQRDLKLNAQRKTELNWIVEFSWVEFSSVFRCTLNRRRAATSCDDWRQLSQVLDCQEPATAVASLSRALYYITQLFNNWVIFGNRTHAEVSEYIEIWMYGILNQLVGWPWKQCR